VGCRGPKASNGNFGRYFPPAQHAQILAARARVSVQQTMAQFVLELEKLSHIIKTAPILEKARAYGLRPRLWLLIRLETNEIFVFRTQPNLAESNTRLYPLEGRLDMGWYISLTPSPWNIPMDLITFERVFLLLPS